MSLGSRLREALDRQGWTQSELARRVGTTQPAISNIVLDRKAPSARLAAKMAKVLNVDLDWLLRGVEAKRGTTAMRDAGQELNWHERLAYPDGTRSFGNTRIEIFQATLPVLARETGQNSNDASLHDDVAMEYRLGILSGARLSRFLDAIGWETLEPHFDAVARDRKHRTTRRYRDGLGLLRHTKSLWVLRIDDYGTTGLTGDEFGEGCFSALVRRSQDSQKRNTASGGRFGLGASVFSAVSAFDLILFSSNLATPVDGKTDGRFIGRTFLPYHSSDGTEFEGPFFFGLPDKTLPSRRLSAWASPELLNDLWLTRDDTADVASGTSVLVVGFFDPEQGIIAEQDADVALSRLTQAYVDNFWPAIVQGRLTATFTQYENDRLVQERVVDSGNVNHPFVPLLRNDPTVLSRAIPLHIPKSRETGSGPFEHNARLFVELLPEDRPTLDERINEVALCRRPLMVVRYKPMPHLTLGARPFRALLLAGEAADLEGGSPTIADTAAEEFLSKAEPPQHDDWTAQGTDLVTEYWGGRKALTDLDEAIRQELRKLVAPAREQEVEGPQQLRELLTLPIEKLVLQRRAYVSRLTWLDDRYGTLLATLRLTSRGDGGRVALSPVLLLATETGGGVSLPSTVVSAEGCDVSSDGSIIPHANRRDVTVTLRPDWDAVPIRADLSALMLDVSIVERGAA